MESFVVRRTLFGVALISTIGISSFVVANPANKGGQILSGAPLKAMVNQSRLQMIKTYKENGLIGAITVVKSCYAKISAASSASDRTKCIALDYTGILLENSPNNEFKEMDFQNNDYFSGGKFQVRMGQNLPPLAAKPDSPEKMKTFNTIVTAFKTP